MRYPLLDPLRGVAAAWVFAHHLAYTATPEPPPWADALRLGYFGVPMFFVISGYCLAAAGARAVRTGAGPLPFLRRRLVRILPPFWAAAAAAVCVYAALAAFAPTPATAYQAYLRTAWAEAPGGAWLTVLTLTAGLIPTGELPWEHYAGVNLAFWTLAVELQFYLVVTAAVAAGRRFALALAAVTAVCLPFTLDPAAYRSGWFVPHWAFFALGLGLYGLFARRGGRPLPAPWALLGAAAALMLDGLSRAPLMPDGSPTMVVAELEFALGFTLALAAVAAPDRGANAGALLRYLGASSYSLYLLHVPLMLAAGVLVERVFAPGTPAYTAAVMAAVCVAVAPFYRWVERPCLGAPPAGRPPAGVG